jgi:serine/threonine-protein kinase
MDRAFVARGSRYTISREIASGGMATVYLGYLTGPGGFTRRVAIKRPHPHIAKHPDFRAMLLDEGRLAAGIDHPNVVSTLDVVDDRDELFLVMEYVPGETLAQIQRAALARKEPVPPAIASAILCDVLRGLSAVHGAHDEEGRPLGIVHRDISPQNILVGRDGSSKILDFGVAKAAGRLQVTRDGQLKGKIAYMAPEQMQGSVTSRTDVYAASIVFWELLAGRRLFAGSDEVETLSKALTSPIERPSKYGLARGRARAALDVAGWERLDAVVVHGLARNPAERFASAGEMADALARCTHVATAAEVAAWVAGVVEAPEPTSEPASGERPKDARAADAEEAQSTLTNSARDVLAMRRKVEALLTDAPHEAPLVTRTTVDTSPPVHASPRGRHRRTAVLVAASVAIASLAAVAIASRPHAAPSGFASEVPTPAPSITATAAVSADDAPAPPDTANVAASSETGAGSESARTPAARVKTVPKNRVERPRRAPVDSHAIDVSHAIDQRH